MQTCPLCGIQCPGGHFHSLEWPQTQHLCGAEHQCMLPGTLEPRMCDESAHPGGRSTEGEVEHVERVFQGRRHLFLYEPVMRQKMLRKPCTVRIPAGQMCQSGPCSCGRRAGEHYCGAPCPQCEYRCGYGIAGLRAAFTCTRTRNARLRCVCEHLVAENRVHGCSVAIALLFWQSTAAMGLSQGRGLHRL